MTIILYFSKSNKIYFNKKINSQVHNSNISFEHILQSTLILYVNLQSKASNAQNYPPCNIKPSLREIIGIITHMLSFIEFSSH